MREPSLATLKRLIEVPGDTEHAASRTSPQTPPFRPLHAEDVAELIGTCARCMPWILEPGQHGSDNNHIRPVILFNTNTRHSLRVALNLQVPGWAPGPDRHPAS